MLLQVADLRLSESTTYFRNDESASIGPTGVLVAGMKATWAEEQNIESHRNSEKNSAQQQPLCPCHGSPSSFVLQGDSASLMPLVNRRRV